MSSPRVAIVTGSAQGIGRAIALRLADDGLDVVLADLPSKSTQLDELITEIASKGRRSLVVHTDVSVEDQVEHLVQQTVSTLGRLDVMVANAGVTSISSILNMDSTHLRGIWSVNVMGTIYCFKHAAKAMIEQKRGGTMIAAASLSAKKGAPFFAAYSASKAAIRSFTHTAAMEFATHGITVNAYAPGPVQTAMVSGLTDQLSALFSSSADIMDIAAAMTAKPLLGRTGLPEDIAGLVSFLASKDSANITGQCISIDGGMWFD